MREIKEYESIRVDNHENEWLGDGLTLWPL